jgi:hypothetical protein
MSTPKPTQTDIFLIGDSVATELGFGDSTTRCGDILHGKVVKNFTNYCFVQWDDGTGNTILDATPWFHDHLILLSR